MLRSDFRQKIVDLPELLHIRQQAAADRQTVVLCHGCFDIVHPGHIRHLEFARQQGDILVVSLTSDSAIDKGPTRPYIPQELRAENLAALECVDYVYIDPNPTACFLLSQLQPDIYVKGREYETSDDPRFLKERQVVESYGGKVVFSSGQPVFSSTEIIRTLPDDPDLRLARLASICQRHQIDLEGLGHILRQFAGRRVVVVGDLLVDTYVHCDATGIASEAPSMSLTALREENFLGGAGIVAAHLACMHAEPFIVAVVGRDEWSCWAAKRLGALGVDSFLHPARESLVRKVRYLADGQKVLKVDYGQPAPLDSRSERAIAGALLDAANDAEAVIWCDYGYGVASDGLIAHVGGPLRRKANLIVADVSSRGRLLRFNGVDLLTPTERELRTAAADFDSGLSHIAWQVLQATQAGRMLVTMGKKGLVLFDRPASDPDDPEWAGRLYSEYLPPLANADTDPLGCGDALLAATTLALASGANPMQAAYLGSVAAAIELSKQGNLPVGLEAIRKFLRNRPELLPENWQQLRPCQPTFVTTAEEQAS